MRWEWNSYVQKNESIQESKGKKAAQTQNM